MATTNVTVNQVLPQVSLIADLPIASESAGSSGELTLTRTFESDADLFNPLTVQYTLDAASTAVAGVDYAPLSGTVTFDAGNSTATIQISPLDAGKVGGSETVILTILPGSAYTISAFYTAEVTILDDDTAAPAMADQATTAVTPDLAGYDSLCFYYADGSAAGNSVMALSGDVVPMVVSLGSESDVGQTYTFDYKPSKITISTAPRRT